MQNRQSIRDPKYCTKCNQLKPLSEFSISEHSISKRTGEEFISHHSICKICESNYRIEHYSIHRRKWSDTTLKDAVDWQKDHPTEVKVGRILKQALRNKVLIKPTNCSICNKIGRLNGHHDDYNKQLEVRWVCQSCHKKIHLGIIK